MKKRARGEIRVHQRADGLRTYSLRFRVGGRRQSLTLGTDADGWTRRRAERKLEDVLAEVRARVWQPPAPPDPADSRDTTFHEFASRWWAARMGELRPKTQADYEWQLGKHLLPFFADRRLSEIDVALVDRYREDKLTERERVRAAASAGEPLRDKRGQTRKPLSNGSINKTLVTLSLILESAIERGVIANNPASGRRRRLKTSKPVRRLLEADDLKDLLTVAGEMDRTARRYRIGRRPMIAVMAKSGLRVTEMCQLRWRDVDVHHQRLLIGRAKTDAGVRDVDLSLDVMEELMAWRAASTSTSADAFVFATESGRPRDKDNVRQRVLGPVVRRTNELRERRGVPALPPVSPHALRRTYISLLIEAGAPLPYVMRQVGHEDSRTTLEVYAQVQQRLSRKQVHQAFDDLLASAGEPEPVPTEAHEKPPESALAPDLVDAEIGASEGGDEPRGPREWSTDAK
ncbi:MAG: tyrosine-type recombinase/integrase [Solirubrobacteraceae bacterium]